MSAIQKFFPCLQGPRNCFPARSINRVDELDHNGNILATTVGVDSKRQSDLSGRRPRKGGVCAQQVHSGTAISQRPAVKVDFLAPLYASVDGATFERGYLRIYPLAGFKEHGAPTLMLWNSLKGWKQFEPPKLSDRFYFCSNVFGDLFGVQVTPDLEMSRDRIGILWIERYEYQEAGVEWRNLFSSIF